MRLVTEHAETPEGTRIFHGWWIVLTAFVCHAVNVGLIFYAWGVFVTPLAEYFGGHAAVATGYALMQVAAAGYGLAAGWATDRWGARPVQLVGAAAMAVGFASMAHVESLAGLYVCFLGPLAIGVTSVGGLPANAAVARWFVRRRGTALGISTAGISFGGIVFAPLAQYLIDTIGWRDAYSVLAAVVVLVVVPPVVAFMRRDPADLGLLPDGEPAPSPGPSGESRALLAQELERSVTARVAVRTSSFWLLAGAFGLTMAGIAAALLYQVPLLIDRGMPPAHASLVLGATAAMGMLGKLGFGAMLDRYDQRRVAAGCFLAQALGIAVLWLGTGPIALVAYVILYGYAMGGNATLQASLIGAAFGRLHYGTIASRVSPAIVLLQGAAVPATGLIRDRFGTLNPALAAIVVASLVAIVLVLRVQLHQAGPSRT